MAAGATGPVYRATLLSGADRVGLAGGRTLRVRDNEVAGLDAGGQDRADSGRGQHPVGGDRGCLPAHSAGDGGDADEVRAGDQDGVAGLLPGRVNRRDRGGGLNLPAAESEIELNPLSAFPQFLLATRNCLFAQHVDNKCSDERHTYY